MYYIYGVSRPCIPTYRVYRLYDTCSSLQFSSKSIAATESDAHCMIDYGVHGHTYTQTYNNIVSSPDLTLEEGKGSGDFGKSLVQVTTTEEFNCMHVSNDQITALASHNTIIMTC